MDQMEIEMEIDKYNNNEKQHILEIVSNKDIQSKVPTKKRGRHKKVVNRDLKSNPRVH